MKKQLVVMLFFLFVAGISFAQTHSKPPVKKAAHALEKPITGSGLPRKGKRQPGRNSVRRGKHSIVPGIGAGNRRPVYNLLQPYRSTARQINDTKYKYLLQQNDHFDILKIGVSAEDSTVYLRADLYKSATNAVLVKRVIAQVANVNNIIGGDLK